MTGKIIRLPPDPHSETQQLLPWYVAGRLDAADRARVDGHLAACPRCRAELALERRLEIEVAKLPVEADMGWAQMLRRIETSGPAGVAGWARRLGAPWLGWGVAASFALVFAWVVAIPRQTPSATYHTLSAAAPATTRRDAIVVFRPDAGESAIEEALHATHARIVDGPTEAGAYVLDIPFAQRQTALADLRGYKIVEMAEPIDAGGSR